MNRQRILVVCCGFAVIAAIMLAGGPGYQALAQDNPPPRTPPPDFPGEPLPTGQYALFSGSGACTNCHSTMTDESGADVSIDAFWRSTMMANAARDPYWQASVRAETLNLPQYEAVIEDKCATCHMPMARFSLAEQGDQALVLDGGLVAPENPLHTLAMDGNSCTLCHQIAAVALGEQESFSGHFAIDTQRTEGERLIFSRFGVPKNFADVMLAASGFDPVQGAHIVQAGLCATCHTLYTPYVDASEAIVGTFPEQMPFFEWLHSDYGRNNACQTCHMPQAQGGVVTSVTGGVPREPFAQHVFVGGNAYMMTIFQTFGEDMNVTASSDQFEATHARTINQLRSRAATLSVENAGVAQGRLSANVVIHTTTGHKFPTGFPSRRVWLHVTVTDGEGAVVFESGAVGDEGRIIGDDHDDDATRYEPHHKVIYRPEDVQIYQSIMVDTENNVTDILLHGAGYVKDNRLLPAGFDKTTAAPEIAVDALALEDANFVGGGDRTMYSIDVSGSPGPFTVTAELLYQSIGYQWMHKLTAYESEETTRFVNYYSAVPNDPVVIDSVTITVNE